MTDYPVSTSGGLTTAIASAVGGDTITLAAGNYGSRTITKKWTGSYVTIRSAAGVRAKFTYLYIQGASYVRFENIDVEYTFAGEAEGFQNTEIDNSDYVQFFKCGFYGANNGSGFPTGRGCYIIYSSYVTVEKCLITGFGTNCVSIESDHITFTGCEVRDGQSDGFTIGSTNDLSVTGCYIHSQRPDGPGGGHCDFFQLFTSGQSRTCKRVTFTDNILDMGTAAWTQSYFTRNEMLDGAVGTDEAFRYEDIVVERNWIRNAHAWGIYAGEALRLSIKDNILIAGTMNMSDPYNNYTVNVASPQEHTGNGTGVAIPILAVAPATGAVTITGNRWYGGSWSSASRLSLPGSTTGWTISDNVLDKDTSGPARPAFSLGWGEEDPAPPSVTAIIAIAGKPLIVAGKLIVVGG